jgi:hypothetical protein
MLTGLAVRAARDFELLSVSVCPAFVSLHCWGDKPEPTWRHIAQAAGVRTAKLIPGS